jgi:titin
VAALNQYGESRERASVTLRTTGVPTTPLNLTYTYGDQFIDLAWEEPEDDNDLRVLRYHIYRHEGTGPPEFVGMVNSEDPRFRDRLVDVGVTYWYHVTAENLKGESEPSEEIEAMTMVPPDPPTDVAAVAEERFVRITWSPSPFDGASPVTGYRVYLGQEPGDAVYLGGVNVEGVVAPSLVFLHDVPYDGAVRHYFVRAVNVEGEGEPSAVVATVPHYAPGAPWGLEVEGGDGRLTLSWEAPTDEGGTPVITYTIYRRQSGDDEFQEVIALPVGRLRHVDDGLDNGLEYLYVVTAWNLAGESEPSDEASAVPAGLPDPPTGVVAVGLNGSARITWSPPEVTGGLAIAGFRVYGISEGMQVTLLVEEGPDVDEFLHGQLENGRTYLYAVRAFTPVGESDLSGMVEATPVGAPGPLAGLVALWMEDHVQLAWSAPLDDGGGPIKGYYLHRDDWDAGNWTSLSEMAFSDTDIEWDAAYNYTVFAWTDAGDGPMMTVNLTVPPEPVDPPKAVPAGFLPLMVIVAVLAAAVAISLLSGIRRRWGGE